MLEVNYNQPASEILKLVIPLGYQPWYASERNFIVLEDIKVTMSDGYTFIIKKGTETDMSSIPMWLWSIFKPIDKAFIADLIHDALWVDKIGQINYFQSVYKARKFADMERNLWRKKLAPSKKIKNYITHAVIRIFGGIYYSGQRKIPN